MQKFKEFLFRNFEQFFILLILITIIVINYYIRHKVAFLNFFFLPIIMSGYLLGLYRTVMGAFLCVLLVSFYFGYFPQQFVLPESKLNMFLYLGVWGGFLILSGAVVGKLQTRLKQEHKQTIHLYDQLQENQEELEEAHDSLRDYSENLEEKISSRTDELEKSRQIVESLKVKVEDTLYSTMDSTVVKLMIEGRLRDEKRKISVMFSDLTNFTSYAERMSPELVIRDLNHYLSHMEPILLDFYGHIDKYLGDGIMCEFGAPHDYENYRLMSVVAGLKMQEKLSVLDYPWKMRIGIASGSAIMGLIGHKRQSYTTIGDVVNLSARLEKACPPDSLLIDHKTMEGVSRFVDTRLLTDFGQSEELDEELLRQFDTIRQQLEKVASNEEKAVLLYELGRLHMSIMEAEEAAGYFTRALQIEPENTDYKIAFADASMKKEEYGKIKVKGREQRVAAYEVLGLKDVLLDRGKITARFHEKYKHALELITVPEEKLLRVEVIDGSIGHGKVVGLLCYAIGQKNGDLSGHDLDELFQAGYFADIGKEIISHHLLNRSLGGLSASEFSEIKKHSVESSRILKKMGFDSESLHQIVRHSHENVNGTGYPDGLKGDEIPYGSKILTVADTYDALTSWRPYQDRWDRSAAIDEIRKGVKTGRFDSEIVEALVEILS
ncbi:HD domain-containing phosphohydrolase [Thermodesulfobacteriota bacterium]